MPIVKRPAASTKPDVDQAAADRFIGGAPDAAQSGAPAVAQTKTLRGKQVAINFALPPELLAKVDRAADELSISRAAFIKQALTRAVLAEAI